MRKKFLLTDEPVLMSMGSGSFTVEMTQDEYERYQEIERKYFDMQKILKERAKNIDGESLYKVLRFEKYY